jgi:deoxycytidylate deaminase
MYSTAAPCRHCASLIANSGIVKLVVWCHPYKNGLGLSLLEDVGIWNIDRYNPKRLFELLRLLNRQP